MLTRDLFAIANLLVSPDCRHPFLQETQLSLTNRPTQMQWRGWSNQRY